MTTTEPALPTSAPVRAGARRSAAVLQSIQSRGIFVALIALLVIAALTVDRFATFSNAMAILRAGSFTGIVAVGMTLVIIRGYYADLSVPAVIAVGALTSLALMPALGMVGAVLVALIACTLIGLVNGAIIAFASGNPIIVTLGMQILLTGVIVAITQGAFVYGESDAFAELGATDILGVPTPIIAFIAVALIVQAWLSLSTAGRFFVAAGANQRAARAMGLPTRALGVVAMSVCALTAGFAGVVLAAFTDQANVAIGGGYEFSAIAAVAVGGTSLFGGSGSVWRTVVGVVFVATVDNVLVLLGLPFEARLLATGVVIIIAISFDALLKRSTR